MQPFSPGSARYTSMACSPNSRANRSLHSTIWRFLSTITTPEGMVRSRALAFFWAWFLMWMTHISGSARPRARAAASSRQVP